MTVRTRPGYGRNVGTFATIEELNAENPQTGIPGDYGFVGAAAPFTRVESTGTTFQAPVSGGGVAASMVATPIYEYDGVGNVRARAMPKRSRVLQYGTKLWNPAVLTNTAAITYAAYTGPAQLLAESTTAHPLEITYVTGGFSESAFTGLSIQPSANGLMQMMIWIDDVQNGAPSPLTGSLEIHLAQAAGEARYLFSATYFLPGWNTVQFWDPLNSDQHATLNRASVGAITGTPTINFANQITTIRIRANSATAGSKIRVQGLYTQTIVKPMVHLTFDTSNYDVVQNFCPVWDAAGLKASLRAGGDNAFRSGGFGPTTFLTEISGVYDQGFDVYNGSWSRLGLSSSTSEVDFVKEVALQTNWQNQFGLQRGNCLFSSAGNSLPKASIYRANFPKFGVGIAKGPRNIQIQTFGPAGLDDRLNLNVTGFAGRTAALRQLRVLQLTGGILTWFAHQCEVAGAEPPPDSASPGSGGGIYKEDAIYLAAYLAQLQGQGLVEVVSASSLNDILDGIA